jgi:hypothetical protein
VLCSISSPQFKNSKLGEKKSHTIFFISICAASDSGGMENYDAAIGRFISADSIVPDLFDPQSLNRYSYCLNNPLKFVDPSGHGPGDYDWYMAAVSAAASGNDQAAILAAEIAADSNGQDTDYSPFTKTDDFSVSRGGVCVETQYDDFSVTTRRTFSGDFLVEGGGYEITVNKPVMFGVLVSGGSVGDLITGAVDVFGKHQDATVEFRIDSSTPLLAAAFLGGIAKGGGNNYPNQALDDLQKLAKSIDAGRGITVEEANILKQLGKEVGLTADIPKKSDVHGPEAHPGRSVGKDLHLNIGSKHYLINDPWNFKNP